MSKRLDQVVEVLEQGKRLVLVQDEDAHEYSVALLEQEASGEEAPRPVLEWDLVDGYMPPLEYPDELPEAPDLTAALEFVKDYRGRAIFVFDCRGVDFSEGESRLRKLLRQIDMKLTASPAVTAVLIAHEPIPASLSGKLTWIGDETKKESGDSPHAPARSQSEYRDLRDLQKFDTPAWADRLDRMSPEEVEQLVKSSAYKDSLERFNELRTVLKRRFARKDPIIDAVCAATVAQVPTVLIGPPGTAKSNLIRCFCEGLGLTANAESNGSEARGYFEYLLTRYTTPEEIFGPIHVQDLIEKQIYRRVTDGYLPEAQIAFLDEIFKASSAILNTLLTLLNERIFYNAGQATKIPLMMVFAASNEAPADEGLQALYDRFPLRLNCQSVDDEHVDELLAASWQQAYDRQFGTQQIAVKRCACANDLRLLRHIMRVRYGGRNTNERSVGVGVNFGDEFMRFFRSLRSDFGISDRTISLLLAFCRAQALLGEQSELTTAELDVFRHVVWDESGTGELDRMVNNMKRGVRI
ncbi:MAG: AAA family ATPase [Pirellulaceae bacterium]